MPPNDEDAVMIDLAPITEPQPGGSASARTMTTGNQDGMLDFGPVQEQGTSKGLTQTAKVCKQWTWRRC